MGQGKHGCAKYIDGSMKGIDWRLSYNAKKL